MLMEESDLLSFKTIESLDLEIERGDWDPSDYPSLNPSLFPALRTLTIASDHHLETILSKFFSSPPLPLVKLTIDSCNRHFLKTTLRKFASKHGYECGAVQHFRQMTLRDFLSKHGYEYDPIQLFWEMTLMKLTSKDRYENEPPSRVQEGSSQSKHVVSTCTLVRSGGVGGGSASMVEVEMN